eukprot:GILI01008257.1.p1 GENE.GILI01008257.1~~GILI01008257.1.p1  ORF type:complete len:1678 (+),score=191.54 GILI01008257.1:358-5034(+)
MPSGGSSLRNVPVPGLETAGIGLVSPTTLDYAIKKHYATDFLHPSSKTEVAVLGSVVADAVSLCSMARNGEMLATAAVMEAWKASDKVHTSPAFSVLNMGPRALPSSIANQPHTSASPSNQLNAVNPSAGATNISVSLGTPSSSIAQLSTVLTNKNKRSVHATAAATSSGNAKEPVEGPAGDVQANEHVAEHHNNISVLAAQEVYSVLPSYFAPRQRLWTRAGANAAAAMGTTSFGVGGVVRRERGSSASGRKLNAPSLPQRSTTQGRGRNTQTTSATNNRASGVGTVGLSTVQSAQLPHFPSASQSLTTIYPSVNLPEIDLGRLTTDLLSPVPTASALSSSLASPSIFINQQHQVHVSPVSVAQAAPISRSTSNTNTVDGYLGVATPPTAPLASQQQHSATMDSAAGASAAQIPLLLSQHASSSTIDANLNQSSRPSSQLPHPGSFGVAVPVTASAAMNAISDSQPTNTLPGNVVIVTQSVTAHPKYKRLKASLEERMRVSEMATMRLLDTSGMLGQVPPPSFPSDYCYDNFNISPNPNSALLAYTVCPSVFLVYVDIEASGALLTYAPDAFLKAQQHFNYVVLEAVRRYNGYVVKNNGQEGFIIALPCPVSEDMRSDAAKDLTTVAQHRRQGSQLISEPSVTISDVTKLTQRRATLAPSGGETAEHHAKTVTTTASATYANPPTITRAQSAAAVLTVQFAFFIQQSMVSCNDWAPDLLRHELAARVKDPRTGTTLFNGPRPRIGIVHHTHVPTTYNTGTRRTDFLGPAIYQSVQIGKSCPGGDVWVSPIVYQMLVQEHISELSATKYCPRLKEESYVYHTYKSESKPAPGNNSYSVLFASLGSGRPKFHSSADISPSSVEQDSLAGTAAIHSLACASRIIYDSRHDISGYALLPKSLAARASRFSVLLAMSPGGMSSIISGLQLQGISMGHLLANATSTRAGGGGSVAMNASSPRARARGAPSQAALAADVAEVANGGTSFVAYTSFSRRDIVTKVLIASDERTASSFWWNKASSCGNPILASRLVGGRQTVIQATPVAYTSRKDRDQQRDGNNNSTSKKSYSLVSQVASQENIASQVPVSNALAQLLSNIIGGENAATGFAAINVGAGNSSVVSGGGISSLATSALLANLTAEVFGMKVSGGSVSVESPHTLGTSVYHQSSHDISPRPSIALAATVSLNRSANNSKATDAKQNDPTFTPATPQDSSEANINLAPHGNLALQASAIHQRTGSIGTSDPLALNSAPTFPGLSTAQRHQIQKLAAAAVQQQQPTQPAASPATTIAGAIAAATLSSLLDQLRSIEPVLQYQLNTQRNAIINPPTIPLQHTRPGSSNSTRTQSTNAGMLPPIPTSSAAWGDIDGVLLPKPPLTGSATNRRGSFTSNVDSEVQQPRASSANQNSHRIPAVPAVTEDTNNQSQQLSGVRIHSNPAKILKAVIDTLESVSQVIAVGGNTMGGLSAAVGTNVTTNTGNSASQSSVEKALLAAARQLEEACGNAAGSFGRDPVPTTSTISVGIEDPTNIASNGLNAAERTQRHRTTKRSPVRRGPNRATMMGAAD